MDDVLRDKVLSRIVQLREADDDRVPSFTTIASIINDEMGLGTTKDAVQKMYRTRPGAPEPTPVSFVAFEDVTSFRVDPDSVVSEGDASTEFDLTDWYRKRFGDSWVYTTGSAPVKTPETYRKVVAVGDLHGSPIDELGQLLAAENPDLIVFGGDSLDNKEASQHDDEQPLSLAELMDVDRPKPYKRSTDDEIAAVRALIQWLIVNTAALIILMRGNHDNWTWKTIAKALPKWARKYFVDILDLLTFNLPADRVTVSKTMWTFHYPNGQEEAFADTAYLLPLGDAVLSHMNFTSKLPGGAVRKLAERMAELYKPLGIPDPALLVQFHGHKVCNYDDRAGHRVNIEPGMGGGPNTEGYKVDYLSAWSLGALGFVVFEQYNIGGEWKTDLSTVRVVRPRRGMPIIPESNGEATS